MTEAEWLASGDPAAMLKWLTEPGVVPTLARKINAGMNCPPSDRKLRLFACACCFSMKGLTEEDRVTLMVALQSADEKTVLFPEIAEQADSVGVYWACHASSLEAASRWANYSGLQAATREERANLLRDIVGNPWRPVVLPGGLERCRFCQGRGWTAQTADVFNPPFVSCGCVKGMRRTGPCPWLTPTVLSLAQAAYKERGVPCRSCRGTGQIAETRQSWAGTRECPDCHGHGGPDPDGAAHLDPDRLAVLADALEEAGCENEDILQHLRGPGPHVRGCWVVDLVLGLRLWSEERG